MSRLLECRGLTVRFGGLTALDGLDLDIDEGQVFGLIGPNGSGKTTFFNALTGIYRPASGRIRFRGEELAGRSPQRIYAAGITRTFQRSRLCLPLSVLDNVLIGAQRRLRLGLLYNLLRRGSLRRDHDREAQRAHALLERFSPTLAARAAEPAARLTMIDRRRVEVCRALISEPRLLLLDEPSAGMTAEETRELMDEILAVRAGLPQLSVVIIEHEMGLIERVTERCAVLNFGRKLVEGRYAEVAADARVQEAYLGVSGDEAGQSAVAAGA